MILYECLEVLSPKITDQLVVTNLAGIAREWRHVEDRDGNLYSPYLGQATALALGLALALPHRGVVSLDGDGSMLLDLTVLPVIAHQNPSNLVVIIFDNEVYEGPGGVPTLTASGTNLAGMAREAGIENSMVVRDLSEFEEGLNGAFQADGASLITAKVEMSPRRVPYGTLVGVENKFRFIRYVEKTENIQIIRPPAKALPQDKRVMGPR